MSATFSTNLFNFISDYISRYSKSPAYSEMTEAMGISPRSKSLITRSLKSLEKEGRVILMKKGRNVDISLSKNELLVLGRISAGEPIEAIVNPQPIPMSSLMKGAHHYGLKIKGTSMIDEGICDGDIIICRKADTAREGEIVVALIDHQNVTLKRISYHVKGMVTLIPANENLKPRAYQPERVVIQGVYLGLIRINE